ncbi:ATP-binding protein [Allohahella marinimesophila]|uniref:AAA family ATPase n=1 Tax=Allohahella marinimesophila TaxID=1054972 RepID=A0ABP7PMY2_9GAMM
MDQSTLNSLVSAFDAAPSPHLAKVILLAYLSRHEPQKALRFVDALDPTPDDSEVLEIAGAVASASDEALLDTYADTLKGPQFTLLIEALLDKGHGREARTLYLKAARKDPGIRSDELDARLELQDTKTKLKIVEKTDFAEVTQLSRYRQATTTFDDVVGLVNIKKQIHKKIILPFQKPSLFQRFKKKVGGGVLLYGPPGCGKTLLARATAGECKSSFFNIEISDVLDMYIGESEQKLHAIFEKARNETPSVLFFDELEALAGKREHARSSSSSNTVSQFLTELDGYSQNNEGVLILASTNVPWAIDSAFLRPGRFDRMFFVPPPDKLARAAILRHEMKGRPSEDDIDFELIASKTVGYSGADLSNLIDMAADEAIDESMEGDREVAIGMQHFKQAVGESRPTTTEWMTTARNYARYANDGGRYNEVVDFLQKNGN